MPQPETARATAPQMPAVHEDREFKAEAAEGDGATPPAEGEVKDTDTPVVSPMAVNVTTTPPSDIKPGRVSKSAYRKLTQGERDRIKRAAKHNHNLSGWRVGLAGKRGKLELVDLKAPIPTKSAKVAPAPIPSVRRQSYAFTNAIGVVPNSGDHVPPVDRPRDAGNEDEAVETIDIATAPVPPAEEKRSATPTRRLSQSDLPGTVQAEAKE